MSWLHAAHARLRLVLDRRAAEARMHDEIRFHVEMETERLVRAGLDPADARRRALVAFGGVERYKEEMRDGRGLAWLGGLSLDLRLGLRMLRKHPGLSIVSVVGMAVAIAIGAGAFGFLGALLDPTLPLHEGDRVVAIQNNNVRNPGNPNRQALHDFALWRGRLTTVRDIGAYTADSRTLVLPDGSAEMARVAYMTASGFRVARVAPVLGRPLLDEDEREGAPPVLVITHEEWQTRFDGDTGIVGRQVRLGRDMHTVVGVMPAGFRFPLYYHYWAPLRFDPADFEPGSGPELHVFARLAPGVTLKEAQAELAAVGPADAARRAHLRPVVLPYARPFFDLDSPAMVLALQGIRLAISLLLVVVAVNVSVLVYARTAARAGEIAVRTALGASRRRVVGQLFAEALVLSGLAAVIGLGIARTALAMVVAYQRTTMDRDLFPFWVKLGLSPSVVVYTLALAVLAAVIVGVLPALRATGRDVQAGLQQLSARGSRMALGRTWTFLIVAQVAVSVAVLPYAGYIAGQALKRGTEAPTFPIHEIIRAWVGVQRVEPAPGVEPAAHESAMNALLVHRVEELKRKLEAEPGVAGVSYATRFPGEEYYARVEAEGAAAEESFGVRMTRVEPGLLDVLGVRLVAGRPLAASDAPADTAAGPGGERPEARAAIVNGAFAERLRASGGVLGRRVRLVRRVQEEDGPGRVEKGPWVEVVGVMPDFVTQPDFDPQDEKLYLPATLAQVAEGEYTVSLAVRVRGMTASSFAPRFRQVAAAVDPAIGLHDLRTAANLQWESQQTLRLTGIAVAGTTFSVLLLSAAGIYAMMSFTVARRRREIGIRAALGADARRVLGGIFGRAAGQLGAGVLAGVLLAAAVGQVAGGLLSGERLLLLPLAAAGMLVVGLLAALGPARQGLAVQPTEALKEE